MAIEVYPIGSEVIAGHDVSMTVIGINITGPEPTYECVWWAGRDRKTAWFKDCELDSPEGKKEKIGFK